MQTCVWDDVADSDYTASVNFSRPGSVLDSLRIFFVVVVQLGTCASLAFTSTYNCLATQFVARAYKFLASGVLDFPCST